MPPPVAKASPERGGAPKERRGCVMNAKEILSPDMNGVTKQKREPPQSMRLVLQQARDINIRIY